MKKLLFVLISVILGVCILSSCASEKEKSPVGDDTNTQVQQLTPPPSDAQSPFGKIELTENTDGTKVAKSETGLVVEYSNETLFELYEEYEKIKGKDEAKEAELLEKIQLILEAQMQGVTP